MRTEDGEDFKLALFSSPTTSGEMSTVPFFVCAFSLLISLLGLLVAELVLFPLLRACFLEAVLGAWAGGFIQDTVFCSNTTEVHGFKFTAGKGPPTISRDIALWAHDHPHGSEQTVGSFLLQFLSVEECILAEMRCRKRNKE